MNNITFVTSPRCVGEIASLQFKLSKQLESDFGSNKEYKDARKTAQKHIINLLRHYNNGLLTYRETIELLLKEC